MIPQSFIDLLIQQKRKSRLTGIPQDPYDYAVAAAAGASGRLAKTRTQKLAEAETATQAEQFGQTLGLQKEQFGESLSTQKLHFTKSLAEQKRAAFVREKEAGLSREAQMESAKKAEMQGYVGMGVQAPIALYAGKELLGLEGSGAVTPAVLPALLAGESAALGAGGAGITAGAGGASALTGTVATAELPLLTGQAPLYAGGEAGAMAAGEMATTEAGGMGLGSQIALGVGAAYLGGKVLEATEGVKEIPQEVAEVGGFVADVIEAPFKAVAAVIGGGSVLCTELCRQGLLPDEIYEADSEYGRQVDLITIRGYHSWGIPLARAMRKSKIVTYMTKPLINMWAYHMAFKMGVVEKDNLGGIILEAIGLPLCKWIGLRSLDISDTIIP